MRSETAKLLAWPWETKFVYESSNLILKSFSSPKYQVVTPCPSIEEMLERMPSSTTIIKQGALYVVWSKDSHVIGPDSLSKALALLCIWLRDNQLMVWG